MGTSNLRDFPRDSIQGAAGKFADTYSNYMEAPWQFFAMGYLTCLGSIISHRITLESEISPQPRLYSVIVGESADDRKSASITQLTKFFTEVLSSQPASFLFNVCQGLGSAEGLATRVHATHNLLLVYDELKSFVSKAQIEGSILMPCINTLFESNVFHSSTKKKSILLDDIFLSLLGACTIETYKRMWTSAFLDIGFVNRLFLVTGRGERRFAIPKMVPDDEKELLESDLINILKSVDSLSRQGGCGCYAMPIEPEAYDIFESWYLLQQQSIFTKRLDTYGHRLLILLAINEGEDRITPFITQRVIDLLDWELEVRKILDPFDYETLIAKIEGVIRRALDSGPLSNRDLQKKCNASRFGIYYWKVALRDLLSDEQIKLNDAKQYELCC